MATTESLNRPISRVAKELIASSGFLLARLGFGFKGKAIQLVEEAGGEIHDYGLLAILGEGTRETQGTIAAALALDPSLSDARVDMGACYVRVGKYDEGIAAFDEVLKHDPKHKKASFNKGVALMQSGKPKEAVAVWEALIKQYPDDPQLAPLRDQIAQVRAGGKM